MLLSKILEGFIRLFGRIGFDSSRHAVDSGLLGACGLIGCCGPRKKSGRRHRSNRRRNANHSSSQTQTRDSDLSSYMPPVGGIHPLEGNATPPRLLNADSRKGSAHSQPPSVLKPEHANIPYKEELDSDDEGYIMGAWQPFPRPGYTAVRTGVQQQNSRPSVSSSGSVPTSSGFSRVGGGRAHIDSPYAIATGSTQNFPSFGQQSAAQTSGNYSPSALASPPLLFDRDDDEAPIALSKVAIGENGLPSGAMQPAHIRTKSQTAIIEDYLPNVSGQASTTSMATNLQQQSQASTPRRQTHVSEDTFLRPPSALAASKFTLGSTGSNNDDDYSGDEHDQQKKKKPWYHLRRNRPHSSEGRTSAADLGKGTSVDQELGGLGSRDAPQAQRSFVVIRKPAGSMGRLNQATSDISGANTSSQTYPPASSRPPTR